MVNASHFVEVGYGIIYRSSPTTSATVTRCQFKAFFGVTSHVCSMLWNPPYSIAADVEGGGTSIHLLWALMLLKTYASEASLSALAGTTPKTLRKWAWRYIDAMSYLEGITVSLFLLLFLLFIHFINY